MFFSIIMPVYNIGDRLERAFESLCGQTFQDFEVIIVNDGSNDEKTIEICKKYSAENDNFKFISKTNTGVSDTRNVGIQEAKGDYITFLDGDDFFCKDCLENYAKAIKCQKADVDIILSNYIRYEETSEKTAEVRWFKQNEMCESIDINSFLLRLYENSYYGWLVTAGCFKRTVIVDNNIFFREDLLICEDLDWLLRLYAQIDNAYFLSSFAEYYCVYPRRRTAKLTRYESQVRAAEYWIREFNAGYEVHTAKIMQKMFAQLFIVFSTDILDMNKEEKEKAYRLCGEKLYLASYSDNKMAKAFYKCGNIFGIKRAVVILGSMYRIRDFVKKSVRR